MRGFRTRRRALRLYLSSLLPFALSTVVSGQKNIYIHPIYIIYIHIFIYKYICIHIKTERIRKIFCALYFELLLSPSMAYVSAVVIFFPPPFFPWFLYIYIPSVFIIFIIRSSSSEHYPSYLFSFFSFMITIVDVLKCP